MVIGLMLAVPADAQGPRAAARHLAPARDERPDPPIEPAIGAGDPDVAAQAGLADVVAAIHGSGEREHRLAVARRAAPFDLDWGL